MSIRNYLMIPIPVLFLMVALLIVPVSAETFSVLFGTPPASGQLIEDMAVAQATGTYSDYLWEGATSSYPISLPRPVFSSGQWAENDQCMWSINVTGIDIHYFDESQLPNVDIEITATSFSGNIRLSSDMAETIMVNVTYEVSVIAFKTTAPVGNESVSMGEIKSIYRK